MRDVIPEGIDEAREALCNCVNDCKAQNKWDSISTILGGFSQGAMLTVDTAIRGTIESVVGLLVFSGALICESTWRSIAKSKDLNLPLVQSHGRLDPVLHYSTGKWLHSLLLDIGCEGDLITFDGPHTIPSEATEQASKLLAQLS
jgi:phospholipase/carboxylesterase